MLRGNRIHLKLALAILILVTSVALFACTGGTGMESEATVTSVSVISEHDGAYVIGEDVDLSEISILIKYSNGEEKTEKVEDYMLSDSDRELFFTKGTYTVFINYGGAKAALQISVVTKEETESFIAEFKSMGGSTVENFRGTTINAFNAPIRSGYTFDGWYVNYDLSGNKAIAPYNLTKNTTFYAKWVDNRRCTVTFLDDSGEIVDTVILVYGEKIDLTDLESYPVPEIIEGKLFSGWFALNGQQTESVTTDITVRAEYVRKDCLLQIYTDADAVEDPSVRSLKYGDTFNVNDYDLPVKEGHQSRWVVYLDDSSEFTELPNSGIITATSDKVLIKAYHVINTYSIEIENGNKTQTKVNLKAGVVETSKVYKDDEKKTGFKVDYGNNFTISNFTETPYLVTPQTITGYNAVWCVVVTTATGELWYNAYNQIWNSVTNRFEPAADGVKSTFDIYDEDSNYLAHIEGDNSDTSLSIMENISNIKRDIVIKPKYFKKNYSIRLNEKEGTGWTELETFDVPYLSDFKLYDWTMTKYNEYGYISAEDVERGFLPNSVPTWLDEVGWNDIYWRTDSQLEEDWTIEWYMASNMSPDSKVDFLREDGTLGSIEISENINLYRNDIDERRYVVTLYYGYDFTKPQTAALNEVYKYRWQSDYLTADEVLTIPADAKNSIMREYSYGGKNYNFTYTHSGWYDHRYNDVSGYEGVIGYPENPRTRNLYFYAHYSNTASFTLTINDKTQSMAYDERGAYENAGYDVESNSIVYTDIKAGEIFDSASMLFKGRDGVSGQNFYNKYAFINWFDGEYTTEYNSILSTYGGDYATAVGNLNTLIRDVQTKIADCEALWGKLYNYNYDGLTKAEYEAKILTDAEYYDKQNLKKRYELELEVLTSYIDNLSVRNSYATDMSVYKVYNNSVSTLNKAYDYTDEQIALGDVKYKFLGWYTDENYTELWDGNIDFTIFVSESLELYAKWADQEKGTEGLVFQKVVVDGETCLVVVDFINANQYLTSNYYGCGYNNFTETYYSLNLNDQDQLPVSVGVNIEVQVPKQHGGTNASGYKVIGVLENAFIRYGNDIKTITLPSNIRFVEENAFRDCTIENIYISDSDYVEADESRALYQVVAYKPTTIDTVGQLAERGIDAKANVLLAYAINSGIDYLTLRASTTKIAQYTFSGANKLKYVGLNNALTEIGKYAFDGSALVGGYDSVNNIGLNTLSLPDSLVNIEKYAFKSCVSLLSITTSNTASLSKVGQNALSSTGWFVRQKGIIILNNLLIGIRGGNENDFDKDVNGEILYYGTANNEARISSGNNYLYYRFENNKYKLTKIVINDTLTTICDYAFSNSYTGALEEVSFAAAALSFVGNNAFDNCIALTAVYFENATNTMQAGENVFKGCSSVAKVYVPDRTNMHSSWESYLSRLENI